MRLLIGAVGKLKPGAERQLYGHYLGRADALARSLRFSPVTSIEVPEAKARSVGARQAAEAEALLRKVPAGHVVVCLDPQGQPLSSEAFSSRLAQDRSDGVAGLAFLIGGADGFGPPTKKVAGWSLSLGPMTLPHGLARIVLAEQLYRAMTILAGHPYHRGKTTHRAKTVSKVKDS